MEGYASSYHLLALEDPLRTEMAPFTGDYFQYLRSNISGEKPIRSRKGIITNEHITKFENSNDSVCFDISRPLQCGRYVCTFFATIFSNNNNNSKYQKIKIKEKYEIALEDGWQEDYMDDYLVRLKLWTTLTKMGDNIRLQGDRKRTYEVRRIIEFFIQTTVLLLVYQLLGFLHI